MTEVLVAEYAPDQAPRQNQNHPIATGVYPRADGADGPLRGAVVISAALASTCRGAFSAVAGGGTGYVLAGTATKLYVLSGTSWTDKSGATTFALPVGAHWRWAQFGERVIATNLVDGPYAWTLGSGGDFAVLSAGAPKARHIATIEPGFVMLGYYDGGTATPNGVWWSALNDATSWPTIGTSAAASVQSDLQQLPIGGTVTGILGAIGGSQGAVFTERAIYRIEYVGPPAVFAFREMDRVRGCVAPQSLTQVGGIAYFVAEDGFCAFDGTAVRRIGLGKVDRTFLAEVDATQMERIYATVDLDRNLVIWAYPSASAAGGNPNRWLIYNYASDRWRACSDAAIVAQVLFPARSAGYTLDTLDTPFPGGPDASNGFQVDSPLYLGGRRLLAAFDTSNRLAAYEGATLAARVETGDVDAMGRRIFVSGIRPLTDASSPRASVGYRDTLSGGVTYTGPVTAGADAVCPFRVDTRYARGRIDIAAGAVWNYLQGIDVTLRKTGRR